MDPYKLYPQMARLRYENNHHIVYSDGPSPKFFYTFLNNKIKSQNLTLPDRDID